MIPKGILIIKFNLRFGEAGVFAKSYIPSKIEPTYEAWKSYLENSNKKILHQRLANPIKHNSQFPELADLLKCGEIVNQWMDGLSLPAYAFTTFQGKYIFD